MMVPVNGAWDDLLGENGIEDMAEMGTRESRVLQVFLG